MAENRYSGNNRLDNPNQGRGFFDRSLGFNKYNLPIVTQGWEGYVLNTDAFGIAQASALSVRSTEFDDKDFQKNLITYRAEARIELLSFQPKAAVYGTTGTA